MWVTTKDRSRWVDYRSQLVILPAVNQRVSCSKVPHHYSQGSKLTLANSLNASVFDNLRVRKISTSKRLRVRIIHTSQFVESCSNARRNVRTTSEANKTADHAEKSMIFSNSELQCIGGSSPDNDKGDQYLIPFLLNCFQLINRPCKISILIFISDMVIDVSKEKNLLVFSPVY